jgi:hypothetical protein
VIEAQSQYKSLLTVDLTRQTVLHASVGDTILVKSSTFPVIPANLNKAFVVEYSRDRLRLLSEEPLGIDGRIGRRFWFTVITAGEARITVQTLDAGSVVETTYLHVTVDR